MRDSGWRQFLDERFRVEAILFVWSAGGDTWPGSVALGAKLRPASARLLVPLAVNGTRMCG